MRVLLNVYVERLDDKINRKIEVNSSIKLDDLCEYIIISLNGKKTYNYSFEDYSMSIMCEEEIFLDDLNIDKNSKFVLYYDFDSFYYINIEVIDILGDEDNSNIFKVVDGNGYGLLDDSNLLLFNYFNHSIKNRKKFINSCTKSFLEFINKIFDLDECNNRVISYMIAKKERIKPKTYIFNISLDGFAKDIKRKIAVNNDISINEFCRKVVLSMSGYLSHCYGLKIGKGMLDESCRDLPINAVILKDKIKLKVIYDFGDNWIINVSLSKVVDGYSESNFSVLFGKGYGLVDDCGGPYYLEQIFKGKSDFWEKIDINDFNLEECNKAVGN